MATDPLHADLHSKLVNACNKAVLHGRPDEITSLRNGIPDRRIQRMVSIWIEKFAPVVSDSKDSGKYKLSKERRATWNEFEARSKPFWELARDLRTASLKTKTDSPKRSDLKGASSREMEAARKIAANQLRAALVRFIATPRISTKESVIEMMISYQMDWESKIGSSKVSIVSGGLPSLGKRAR